MLQLKETHDGSFTLFNETLNETYHSIHGARQEALHVFIAHGLKVSNAMPLNILEIGLGTGLNAMLTFRHAEKKRINYIAIEPYPIEQLMIDQVINCNAENADEQILWQEIMHATSDEIITINDSLTFCWHQQTLQAYQPLQTFDLVYFDAFAPNKQSEMWEVGIFEKLLLLMNSGGLLVSYCAQGQFKRNLKTAGFNVETRPGPPGKREMTVAYKL